MLVNLILLALLADPPLRPGLDVGKRPSPYSSLVVVGPQRGAQHCFVCEAEDKPVVIVFARTPTEPLGKLIHQIDGIVKKDAKVDIRAWTTFLATDASPLEAKLVDWSRKHATGGVSITVFEDVIGPPAYRVPRDADVMVILSNKQKIAASYAFRAGELNDQAIGEIVEKAKAVR